MVIKSQAAIGLGSNLGDSLGNIKNALKILDINPKIQVKIYSSWYQTAPIGPPQPDYINACAWLEVELTPDELLQQLLAIESQFGRCRRERWEARTLDLDLLLFDDLIIKSDTLELPHPRMSDRAFVLVPLAEIAPNWREPIKKKSIQELVKLVDRSGVKKLL